MVRFFRLKRRPAMQRHRVRILTNNICPDVGVPYQTFRTGSAVAHSTQRHAGTSNAGREFVSRGHLNML